ncbi:MAG: patatin-like phospholipase family protein [Lactobacillales bacterium]|jgi:NTE family protein|nr:patatin-like phospholipase family protein [Lactobacillales bacterium]
MKIRYLLASERLRVQNFWQDTWVFLPFVKENSVGLELVLQAMSQSEFGNPSIAKPRQEKRVIGVIENGHVQLLLLVEAQEDVLVVSLAALAKASDYTWNDFLAVLENIVRTKRLGKIRLELLYEVSPDYQVRFKEAGWKLNGVNYEKKVDYQFGIAFGGGGARGAYEIGVWQAFEEAGWDFPVIAGTSIGAATGGLMIASDVKQATAMWEEIETSQILDFQQADNTSEQSMLDMITQIGAMAVASIQNVGISSAPIRGLIEKYYDFDKFATTDKKFIVVVTEIPSMTEHDVEVKSKPRAEWSDWLIASGSFFPAMAATPMNGVYYIDGGYRNNIPVDQVVLNGANAVVSVDVKGPGITKKFDFPKDVALWEIQSPWNLGTVLIFDGNRSTQNIHLGYLETKRYFCNAEGYWYTFKEESYEEERTRLGKGFEKYLVQHYGITIEKGSKFEANLLQKMRKIYKTQVFRESLLLALLETLGRYADVKPTEEYTLFVFAKEMVRDMQKATIEIGDELISISEWFQLYYNQFFVLSEVQQFQRFRSLLQVSDEEKKRRVSFLWDKFPVVILLVLFFEFIEKNNKK